MGDVQNLKGYCLLLADPIVGSINELSDSDRVKFSRDMWAIGDALLDVTHSFRINYSVLGNGVPALHAHIKPRYEDEPVSTRGKYLPARFENPVPFDSDRDHGMMKSIGDYLSERQLVVD